MKTPKEILFKRHEAAAAKLDAIREKVVAEHLAAVAAPRRNFSPAVIALKLWAELIWPCRRIWAGMAAIWLGILMINLIPEERSVAVAENVPATPEVLMVLQEQRQMMAQLLGAGPMGPADRPRVPGPRSDWGARVEYREI